MEEESGRKIWKKQNLELQLINSKENTITIRNMDKALFCGLQEIHIKELTKMMIEKVMVRCNGQMEVNIKECGIKEFNMVLVL